jgi:hypothetical protein
MNYAPLTWYEQECLTYKAHFEALPRARLEPILLIFASGLVESLITKILPVGHTGRYTSS